MVTKKQPATVEESLTGLLAVVENINAPNDEVRTALVAVEDAILHLGRIYKDLKVREDRA